MANFREVAGMGSFWDDDIEYDIVLRRNSHYPVNCSTAPLHGYLQEPKQMQSIEFTQHERLFRIEESSMNSTSLPKLAINI